MDRNQQASTNLLDREGRIIAEILERFRNVMLVATERVSNKSNPGQSAFSSMRISIEAQGLIKSTEELLTLTRKLRELWVVGPLRKTGEGEAEAATSIDGSVEKVVGLLNELRTSSRQRLMGPHGTYVSEEATAGGQGTSAGAAGTGGNAGAGAGTGPWKDSESPTSDGSHTIVNSPEDTGSTMSLEDQGHEQQGTGLDGNQDTPIVSTRGDGRDSEGNDKSSDGNSPAEPPALPFRLMPGPQNFDGPAADGNPAEEEDDTEVYSENEDEPIDEADGAESVDLQDDEHFDRVFENSNSHQYLNAQGFGPNQAANHQARPEGQEGDNAGEQDQAREEGK